MHDIVHGQHNLVEIALALACDKCIILYTDFFPPYRHASCAVMDLLTVTPQGQVALASQEQILHCTFHSLTGIAIHPLWPTRLTALLNQVLIGAYVYGQCMHMLQ